jgi:hypothetical protein
MSHHSGDDADAGIVGVQSGQLEVPGELAALTAISSVLTIADFTDQDDVRVLAQGCRRRAAASVTPRFGLPGPCVDSLELVLDPGPRP